MARGLNDSVQKDIALLERRHIFQFPLRRFTAVRMVLSPAACRLEGDTWRKE